MEVGEYDSFLTLGRPAEILVIIFQLTLLSSDAHTHTAIRLASVSKRWRNLVLGLSELWEWIDCISHPSMIDLCLQRAGPTRMLSFKFYSEPDRVLPHMSVILQNIYRVKVLDLTYGGEFRTFPEGLNGWIFPVTIRERLSIGGYSIPRDLFSGDMTILRDLELNTCRVEWDRLPRFPALDRIALLYPAEHADPGTILKILRFSPNLKSVEFAGLFDGSSDAGNIAVTLPLLEALSIENEYCHDVSALLGRLSYPRATGLVLDIDQLDDFDYDTTLQTLKGCRIGSRQAAWEVQTLAVARGEHLCIYFVEHGHEEETQAADLTFSSNVFDPISASLPHIFTYFDMQHLESLDLNSTDSETLFPSYWATFHSLTKRSDLKVRNSFARSFLEFVRDPGTINSFGCFHHFHTFKSLSMKNAALNLANSPST